MVGIRKRFTGYLIVIGTALLVVTAARADAIDGSW